MPFKLDDGISYLESTLGSNTSLTGNVKWTNKDTAIPSFKNYGVHLYLGLDEPKQVEYRKIGPKVLETWQVNADFVLNKNYKARNSVSDRDGLSYWENYLFSTFFHKQNSGTFRDSWWDSKGVEDMADSFVIRGIFTFQLANQYS